MPFGASTLAPERCLNITTRVVLRWVNAQTRWRAGVITSMNDIKQPNYAGHFGKYTCTRCGWKWSPRPNSPDPPRACARCRSAYWQSVPVSSRANSPNDPKWQAERGSVARRKRERHLARLRELAAEFGLKPPPIPHDNEPTPSQPAPAPRSLSLSERLHREMAQWEPNPEPSLPSGPGQPTRGMAPLK